MLWYKSWLDMRSRFLIGLVVMLLAAAGVVMAYPRLLRMIPANDALGASGDLGRRIREGVDVIRQYRSYVWTQWVRQTLMQLGTLFAVLLGSGGLFSSASGGAGLFTLSMPVTRNRVLGTRAALGFAQLFALGLLSSLLLTVLSPAVGERYALTDALAHALCFFVGAAAFFSLALFLSTVFNDVSRPAVIACGVAVVLSLYEQAAKDQWSYGMFRVMSGEDYFRTGHLPWIGLVAIAAGTAAMLFAATKNLERQDF